jgi:hypothetical protein
VKCSPASLSIPAGRPCDCGASHIAFVPDKTSPDFHPPHPPAHATLARRRKKNSRMSGGTTVRAIRRKSLLYAMILA